MCQFIFQGAVSGGAVTFGGDQPHERTPQHTTGRTGHRAVRICVIVFMFSPAFVVNPAETVLFTSRSGGPKVPGRRESVRQFVVADRSGRIGTKSPDWATIDDVDCDVAREALSARLDGEREPVPGARVDEHLATCPDCSDWYLRASSQAERLRTLAGLGASGPRPVSESGPRAVSGRIGRFSRRIAPQWRRWALGIIGVTQLALAAGQGLGVEIGMPGAHDGAMSGSHLLNESTAWSVALGAVMVVAALRPAAAAGLAGVLATFTAVLTGYVIVDSLAGAVTPVRVLSHLPVVLGAVVAILVWRYDGRPPSPAPQAAEDTEPPVDIVLPPNASRGRRRGHLWPTDGSAA